MALTVEAPVVAKGILRLFDDGMHGLMPLAARSVALVYRSSAAKINTERSLAQSVSQTNITP